MASIFSSDADTVSFDFPSYIKDFFFLSLSLSLSLAFSQP